MSNPNGGGINPGAKPFGRFERTIAKRYLGARKKDGGVGLIAWISFTCIMLAVTAMITIMSIMNGFRADLLSRLLGVGGHIYIETSQLQPTEQDMNDMLAKLRAFPEVESAAPISEDASFGVANNQGAPIIVNGIRANDLDNLAFVRDNLDFGSFEGFGAGRKGGNDIIMGWRLANSLNMSVGDSVKLISVNLRATAFGNTLSQKDYRLIATVDLGYHIADSSFVYMPLEQARLFYSGGKPARSVQVRLKDPDAVDKIKPEIFKSLGPVDFKDWRERNEAIAGAVKVEKIAMRLILIIVIIIAAFPVISAMIMLVKNKGRDIAILRTMGASRKSILRIFFMAGASIGALGTLAGIVLGMLICFNIGAIQSFIEWITGAKVFNPEVYLLSRLPAKIEPLEVMWVAILGFGISAIATYFPARGASKIDPVEALRNE